MHGDGVPLDGGNMAAVVRRGDRVHRPRVWDLAYLAYRLVPLGAPGNPDLIDTSIAERRRRPVLLCASYGGAETPALVRAPATTRLHELAAFTARRAKDGAVHVAAHVEHYEHAARWIAENEAALGGE